jgi:hypothetical protein
MQSKQQMHKQHQWSSWPTCHCQCSDGLDLLVLILETMLDDVNHGLEVGQHGTPHEDGDLLHNLDASVTSLQE